MQMKVMVMVLVLMMLASCGPRRYKCGPGRRCLIEIKVPEPKDIKNPGLPGFFAFNIIMIMMPAPVA